MVKDLVSARGESKLEWARNHMPIHAVLARQFGKAQPFAGLTVAVCSHLEAKTGILIETIAVAGAEVCFTPSVFATAQEDVAMALAGMPGISGFFAKATNEYEASRVRDQLLLQKPDLIIDDGAELSLRLISSGAVPDNFIGICEQTTTGVDRFRALDRKGLLPFPVYAVNDTKMKRDLDNVHGTGESALTNLMQVTNQLLAGKRIVVIGYGYCGFGIAHKARSLGARVTVTEVDPRKAVRAHINGFDVMPTLAAVAFADFIISATGAADALHWKHFRVMRDGVVIGNVGHSCQEVNLSELGDLSVDQRDVRPGIRQYVLEDSRRINVVANAELINLASPCAMGHPIEIIDMTLGMQLLAALRMVENRGSLGPGLHEVPVSIDEQLAQIKLQTLGIEIDSRPNKSPKRTSPDFAVDTAEV